MNVQINRSELVTRWLELPELQQREREGSQAAPVRPVGNVSDLARIRQEALAQWNWEWVSWASLAGSAFAVLVVAFRG